MSTILFIVIYLNPWIMYQDLDVCRNNNDTRWEEKQTFNLFIFLMTSIKKSLGFLHSINY